MKLATILTCALALAFTGLISLPQDADAKRFGAGKSLGRNYQQMQRQAAPPRQAAQPTRSSAQAAPGARTQPQSGMSRWLGPLAGLAAGGLLASMFFGEGFEGISFMDVILIVALLIGGVWLFRMLRGGRTPGATALGATPTPAAATATAAPAPISSPAEPASATADVQQREAAPAESARNGGFTPPNMGSAPPQPQGNDQFPIWFDAVAFIEGAKHHFIRLQEAWDKADLDDIREYTTPDFFADLERERRQLPSGQSTEVVQLRAELVTIQREPGMVVASIHFQGLVREEANGVAEAFGETWHVIHDWDSADGDWLIAGIQQDD